MSLVVFGVHLHTEGEVVLGRIFDDADARDRPIKGLVRVDFDTYHGFLVSVCRIHHEFWAGPDEARQVLGKLHRFNSTRGLVAAGGPLIALLSLGSLRAQLARIDRQVVDASGGVGDPELDA